MLANGQVKHCPKCDQDLPLDAFAKSKQKGDGLTVYCKACRNRTQREKYQGDPELRRRKGEYRKVRLEDPEKHARQIELERRRYYERREDPAYCESERKRSAVYNNSEHGREIKADGQRRRARARRLEISEKHRLYARERYANDPEFRRGLRGYFQRRRAIRRAAGGDFAIEDWQTLVDMAGGKCLRCGAEAKLELDHIQPVVSGGASYLWNLQPLCRTCNAQKGTEQVDYRTPAIIQWLDIATD